MIKAKLVKLKESLDPLHPGNIPVGYESSVSEFSNEKEIPVPQIDEPFFFKFFITSIVTNVINERLFYTANSLYKIEICE
jgi:hypothetical protein